MFVDPITRRTFPFANEIHCIGGYKNSFQLDLDDKLSWYQWMPAPILFKTPLVFAPQDIGHIRELPVYDLRRARMYTPKP